MSTWWNRTADERELNMLTAEREKWEADTRLTAAWASAYARMAEAAIQSVDRPLEEDEERVMCDPLCTGPADPRCVCEGNVAKPGC